MNLLDVYNLFDKGEITPRGSSLNSWDDPEDLQIPLY